MFCSTFGTDNMADINHNPGKNFALNSMMKLSSRFTKDPSSAEKIQRVSGNRKPGNSSILMNFPYFWNVGNPWVFRLPTTQIISCYKMSTNVELQQRSVEYSTVFKHYNTIRPALLERMPVIARPNTVNNDNEGVDNGGSLLEVVRTNDQNIKQISTHLW